MRRNKLKFGRTRAFIAVFTGATVLCLLTTLGLISSWWTALDRAGHKLTIHGVERGYELTLPPRPAKAGAPLPLVILLHGYTETARIAEYRSGFDDVAMREGFAVAYPQGLDNNWTVLPPALVAKYPKAARAAADMDFIEALVDDLVKRGIADPRRVYLSGTSKGGFMTFLIACTRPETFAAVAAIVATMPKLVSQHCDARPTPMLIMDATGDAIVNWQGIDDPDPSFAALSVADTVSFWRRANRCSDDSVKKSFPHLRDDDPTSMRSEIWPHCASGTKVALYTAESSGHQIPSTSGDDLWNAFLGPRNHDIEAGEELWKFFSEFRK